MFCGKPCGRTGSNLLKPRTGPVKVTLHVYDAGDSRVVRGLNAFLKHFGTGAFHCGVEVYDLEWSFADTSVYGEEAAAQEYNDLTGIFYSLPRQAEGHTYCESIDLGITYRPESEVIQLINTLERTWSGETYDVLEKNCCHFCVAFAKELGVQEPPRWTMSLADRAAVVVSRVEDMMRNRRSFAAQLAEAACLTNECCEGGHGAIVERIDIHDQDGADNDNEYVTAHAPAQPAPAGGDDEIRDRIARVVHPSRHHRQVVMSPRSYPSRGKIQVISL